MLRWLANQAQAIGACDFFVVFTPRFRILKTPLPAPKTNAVRERLGGDIRRECWTS